jgi:predicted dehydrogenase
MPLKRIVVVGTGHMGRIHLEKLASMEGVEVTGIVDVDAKTAGELSSQYGIPSFTDYREAVPFSDGAVIAVPTEFHHGIARDFLEKGRHIFVEKPVTSDEKEAQELIDMAAAKGLVFQVGHLERHNPVFMEAAKRLGDPLYIEAYRASPFTGRSTDISVVLDVMIHDIDLVLSLVKDRVKDVRATGFPFVSDKLDMVNARIEFENGCAADITASRIWTTRVRRMAVFEKDRYFDMDLMSGRLIVAAKSGENAMETVEQETPKADSVARELTEFVEAMNGKGKPSVSGEDGLKALKLANFIEKQIAAQPSF